MFSLAYDKAESALLGGGTDHVFGDAPEKVTLRLMPIRSDAHGDDDALFGAVVPVDVNLGVGKVLSGAALDSFPSFGRNGAYVRIRYDIAFADGAALSKLRLPENDAEGPNATSSQSFPIAKLHYTIGLR